MKTSILTILVLITTCVSAETWKPDPKFNIEGSNFVETLTFISGISYALSQSNQELKKQRKPSFICNAPSTIGSKLLMDILNSKYKGSITSEQAIYAIIQGLKERYPCK